MAELSLYEVPHRNTTMVVKLSAEDAELIYGDAARKLGDVPEAKPQPVSQPPYAVDAENPEDEAPAKAAPAPPRDKARTIRRSR